MVVEFVAETQYTEVTGYDAVIFAANHEGALCRNFAADWDGEEPIKVIDLDDGELICIARVPSRLVGAAKRAQTLLSAGLIEPIQVGVSKGSDGELWLSEICTVGE